MMNFSGRFLYSLIHFASERGADVSELLEIGELDIENLSNEDTRIDYKVYNRTIEHAMAATKDTRFGLHAGEYLNISAAGLIAQITMTSRTVLEALQYCCEFASLGCRALPMTLTEEDDFFKLAFEPDGIWLMDSRPVARQTEDGVLAFTLREFHTLTHNKHYPIRLDLTDRGHVEENEFERIFQCDIFYNCESTAMYFKKEHVFQKVVTSDYDLLRTLVAHANEKVQELVGPNFKETVKRSIVNLVKPEFPTIELVASNMNVSVRTLQRKLKDENVTFKDLLEELRREFAMKYIKNKELTISQITYLLNYADSSGFIRSFKRWTGQTPSRYRKSLESR